MDHAVRVHEIKRLVREREVGDGSLHELGRTSPELQLSPRQLQRCGAEVDAGVARSGAHEPHPVGGDAAARLQHIAAGPLVESDELHDSRLEGVAVRVHLVEELRRADRGFGSTISRLVLGPEPAARGDLGGDRLHVDR